MDVRGVALANPFGDPAIAERRQRLERHRPDARHARNPFTQRGPVRARGGGRESVRTQIRVQRHVLLVLEPERRVRDAIEGACQQRGHDEQRTAGGHLSGHEKSTRAGTRASRPDRLQRRHQAEEDRREGGHRQREERHAHVELRLHECRRGRPRQCQPDGDEADAKRRRGAEAREHHAFGQQLPHDSPPRGAERQTGPRSRARAKTRGPESTSRGSRTPRSARSP